MAVAGESTPLENIETGVQSKQYGYLKMKVVQGHKATDIDKICLLYTSPSPRDRTRSRMPSSA